MGDQRILIPASTLHTDSNGQKQWRLDGSDAVLLNSLFSPVGADRYLRRIIGRNDITGSIFQFRLQFGSDTTESAPASGDDLVQPWETRANDAIIIEQGTHTFDISGPGHGLNDASDLSEPYAWSPPFD